MVQAYSRLKVVLEQRKMTLSELRHRLEETGIRAGSRSLSRLGDETQPLERLDLRIAGAICAVCQVPLSELIVFHSTGEGFRRLTASRQQRLGDLLDANKEGTLAEAERVELQELVRETQEITLHNARYLVEQREKAS